MKTYLSRVPIRILAFTVIIAMVASLLPAIPREVSAAAMPSNPRIADDGIVTWDCVWFGHYPQSSDGSSGYKEEKIKWRVLSVNGDEALLLADKGLDAKPYNVSGKSATWETCTIRSWLNGYGSDFNKDARDYTGDNFSSKAFIPAERAAIKEKTIQNPNNPYYNTDGGNDTKDKVFCLSVDEVTEPAYGFPSGWNVYSKTREAVNAEYVKSQGSTEYKGDSCWGLRSPGSNSARAARVSSSGFVDFFGDGSSGDSYAVRPALYLNLKSDSWSDAGTVSSDGRINEDRAQGQDNRAILSYGGHKYQIFANSGLSWTEAKKQCESLGGHLVTISSQGEMDAIVSMFGKRPLNAYWIGLFRKNANAEWQWVTGENVGYTNWANGEPNNGQGAGECCVHMYAKQHRTNYTGQWNDTLNKAEGNANTYYSLSNFGFICEWESAADLKGPQLPVMTTDDAKAFWGFLFNIPQDFRTDEFFENDILDDPIYLLLTGQYAPGSVEEESARRAFMTIVDNQVAKLTDGAVKSQNFLRENLIKCLNKEIGTDPDATGMKGECQAIFDSIRKPFQEKLEDSLAGFVANGCGKKLSSETIANIRCGIEVGADILTLPDKIKTFVNRVEMGVSAAFLSINSELARYRYFGEYLDNRGLVDDPEDLEFQIILDHNKLALKDDNWSGCFTTLLPGKANWAECTDLIERWAETTYLICNSGNTEEPKEPVTEPSKPNVEPSSEANTEPSTKPSAETEPSKESSTKPSSEGTAAPSVESRPKPSEESGAESNESSQFKPSSSVREPETQTITVKPKRSVLIKAASNKKGALKLTWKRDTKATGYQAMVATDKKFKKNKKAATIKKNKTVTKTFTKLKRKKTYYAKVRAYKQVGKTKVYGSYSKVKKAKVK
ncbi:MAG: hypothetical protein HFE75_03095 [Firmicutes bacterium]|jgi:hypothetical protein|nr:hypothetical protein [Bacillota bacterium]